MGSKKLLLLLSLPFFFSVGFRVFPHGGDWPLDKTTEAGSKIFVVYTNGTREVENDLPPWDSLAGVAPLTLDALMETVYDDFNNIEGAYVMLAGQADPDYAANAANRTITIEEAVPNGTFSGGDAQQFRSGSHVVSCLIRIRAELFQKAMELSTVITHEIGHCLGLDHPQEITKSIMSYFQTEKYFRLQPDDKMGITFMYPVDGSKTKETPTFGVSCARK